MTITTRRAFYRGRLRRLTEVVEKSTGREFYRVCAYLLTTNYVRPPPSASEIRAAVWLVKRPVNTVLNTADPPELNCGLGSITRNYTLVDRKENWTMNGVSEPGLPLDFFAAMRGRCTAKLTWGPFTPRANRPQRARTACGLPG